MSGEKRVCWCDSEPTLTPAASAAVAAGVNRVNLELVFTVR